ncbi:MAG TPA: host specificity protein [Gemmatimonadetes bacterium]|nr:host specificity protein [Gemmatimonadota bacterium]
MPTVKTRTHRFRGTLAVTRRRLSVGVTAVAVLSLAGCQAENPGNEGGNARGGGPTGDASVGGSAAELVAVAHENVLIDLWADGTAAFGIFVPNERPPTAEQRRGGERPAPVYTREGGERLAQNPLYDFLFLNLEGGYNVEAVQAIAEGLRSPSAVSRKTLLVRIPPIERDGEAVTRTRIGEILAAGADGVVLPHVRNAEEARAAVSFFSDAGADVWSPSNPTGEILAMIMIEDPGALAAVAEIADTPGYSILACGIGSLTGALGGDREAAEAGNQEVLSHAKRIGVADMITANARDIEARVQEGFLALLMQGSGADETILIGRAAAGR